MIVLMLSVKYTILKITAPRAMIMKKTNVPLSLEVIVQNAFQAFSIIFGVSSVIFCFMIKDKKTILRGD
nr:MAG TPA: hypothetical protein [Caudoviricetes sp.]